MLNLLLVDDEPFILQGLKVLLNYEDEGYEVYTASNGQDALDLIKTTNIDLIISDIKMPEMDGLELLANVRERYPDIYFVILSGYAEFSYAQKALHYDCAEYILKPVEKDAILKVLRKVAASKADKVFAQRRSMEREKAFFDQNLKAALMGRYSNDNIGYLKKHLPENEDMCYVGIELSPSLDQEEVSDEEKAAFLDKLLLVTQEDMKANSELVIKDAFGEEKIYDIGFLFHEALAKDQNLSPESYLREMLGRIERVCDFPITMLVGKMVHGIEAISKSYTTVRMLHSLQGFRESRDIYFYEEEYQIRDSGITLCKKQLDNLIAAIELNEKIQIRQRVDEFHEEMLKTGITGKTMNLNINYLLFQLIHIASEQDSDVNQEEILRLISESSFEEGISRGSKSHLYRMSCEYGDYLAQLRKNVSKGVLADIENEVRENYASNLTLKELSEKYYVNSAYLGQLFRKRYKCSFKDYLNQKRIDEASLLLRKTDLKIYQVAEKVGYRDVDYFVNKFIEAKGCTPAKYRKQEQ
ncbi:two-component system, response regulator YesN [Butyrivibrio sp. ob235]|uniref:response regulator transcription factor n=1 Tax=Butyrivibrio sp. ob235 TaxID=1761780 RepID=UPI0008D899EC|nr:response regulator [Butyrivibrio sp. ob235]SEM28965.1 two-component system, response regulator YesN [Butyrivibrio sp. ob235]